MSAAGRALIDLTPLTTSADYRRQWWTGLLNAGGMQIAAVAVLFQVWEMTRNPFWVGAIGLVQAVPMIVLGLLGGPLADVLDRRRVALGATAAQALTALAMAAQLVTGFYPLPLLLALIALQVGCGALGAPARRTFVRALLPRRLVPAGIALHMISFQATMLVGPALGGVLIGAAGVATCYLVNAVCMLLSCWALWWLPPMPPPAREPVRVRAGVVLIAEGVGLVARNPVLRGSFLLDLAATLLIWPVALFPMVNDELFGGNPETLGLFMSAIAVGGVSTGLASGLITRARAIGRIQVLAVAVFCLALLAFGVAVLQDWAVPALLSLVVAGAADTASVTTRAAMVQLATDDSHLGRVSAVEHVIGVAGPDLGNARAGAVAGFTGPAWSAVLGSLACLGVATWVTLTHREVVTFSESSC